MSVSVVLPAYEEAENLKRLLPEITDALDHTQEICEQNHCTYLRREGGNLYGDAIRTGIRRAKMDYLLIMDADGSHNPKDILRLYDAMRSTGSDVIIGSRYADGGETDNSGILILMSYLVNIVYRVLFHLDARDVSDSFRMYWSWNAVILILWKRF